jgi:hypothetical protein
LVGTALLRTGGWRAGPPLSCAGDGGAALLGLGRTGLLLSSGSGTAKLLSSYGRTGLLLGSGSRTAQLLSSYERTQLLLSSGSRTAKLRCSCGRSTVLLSSGSRTAKLRCSCGRSRVLRSSGSRTAKLLSSYERGFQCYCVTPNHCQYFSKEYFLSPPLGKKIGAGCVSDFVRCSSYFVTYHGWQWVARALNFISVGVLHAWVVLGCELQVWEMQVLENILR